VLDGAQHAQFAFLPDRTGTRFWLRTKSPYDNSENADFLVEEFVLDEGVDPPRYWANCPVEKVRGVYRQFVKMYVRTDDGGHRFATMKRRADGRGRDGVAAKIDPHECFPWSDGQGGMTDFSLLAPQFTPETALRWDVRF